MVLLGNIFSLLGSICSLISTRAKTYKNTLLIQTVDATLYTLSCLCLGGYSGVTINACAIVRNLSCVFLQLKNWMKVSFILVTFILGVLFRDKEIYGWLPIVASTFYAIVMIVTQDIKKLKIGLIINNILWMLYEIVIFDFVGVVFKVIALTSCTQSIIQMKGDNSDDI
ncbi:MAG: YgjV family protein [Lachnospiraceae bacterium]|nr:YgjV family protein [Lachnospiraceae bacterium]